jgi:hypothetical protein
MQLTGRKQFVKWDFRRVQEMQVNLLDILLQIIQTAVRSQFFFYQALLKCLNQLVTLIMQ